MLIIANSNIRDAYNIKFEPPIILFSFQRQLPSNCFFLHTHLLLLPLLIVILNGCLCICLGENRLFSYSQPRLPEDSTTCCKKDLSVRVSEKNHFKQLEPHIHGNGDLQQHLEQMQGFLLLSMNLQIKL